MTIFDYTDGRDPGPPLNMGPLAYATLCVVSIIGVFGTAAAIAYAAENFPQTFWGTLGTIVVLLLMASAVNATKAIKR